MSTTVPAGLSPIDGTSDEHDALLVERCPDVLVPFNRAGVLHPADVHTAIALCRMTGADADPSVLLATALAVRGPRVGHVCVDLATVHETVANVEDEVATLRELPWPTDINAWVAALAGADRLVRRAGPAPDDCVDGAVPCPLTLHGTRLYLDRYWRYEGRTASRLNDRARDAVAGIDIGVLRRGLDGLFGDVSAEHPDLQRLAAATAVTRRLSVIAGGPGTGKTTTVARILALLDQQAAAAGAPAPRIALVAPTGKAAARLEASLREALTRDELSADVRERLAATTASTIHRLLRRHPGNASRFRHDARDPLPHDVVIVDEASMMSLALFTKLLDALSEHARLVLVGDPQQLRSVEAGAVLGDIVGPALQGLRMSEDARAAARAATGEDLTDIGEMGEAGIGDGIVVLQRVHRFKETSGIADLATAIRSGDSNAVLGVLRGRREDVDFVERDDTAEDDTSTELIGIRQVALAMGRIVQRSAENGDAEGALTAMDAMRVVCAHRRGPFGVSTWVSRIEEWLGTRARGAPVQAWQVGRPVLVTQNDHQLQLYNGDVGVVVASPEGPRVAFPTAHGPRLVAPSRLDHTETVHAMTIHKSQGSQFRHAVVVLPGADSRILSRELFYTGVTRAERQVTVVGSEAAVRAAVDRVVQRASGLGDRLWREPQAGH